jgi:hypothetical protein
MKSGSAIPGYTPSGYAIQNAPGWINVSRGAALGLAVITTFNLIEVYAFNTSAVNNWLCNFRMMTQPFCIAILAILATALLMYSMKPALPGSVWMATAGVVVLVAVFAGWDLWDVTQQVPPEIEDVTVIVDAQRAEYFVATYHWNAQRGLREAIDNVRLAGIDDLPAGFPIVGPAGHKLAAAAPGRFDLLDESLWTPHAVCIGRIGCDMLTQQQFADLDSIEPVYIRLSYAEEKRVEPTGRK